MQFSCSGMSDALHSQLHSVQLARLASVLPSASIKHRCARWGSRQHGYLPRGAASRMAGPPLAAVRRPAAAREEELLALRQPRGGHSPRSCGRGVLPHGSHGRRRAISAFPTSFSFASLALRPHFGCPSIAPPTPTPRQEPAAASSAAPASADALDAPQKRQHGGHRA